MTVTGLTNPVRQGKPMTYEVKVTNRGNVTDRRVTLSGLLPIGMLPVALGTTGPDQVGFRITNRSIRFDPVDVLPPGQTLTYRVHVQTRQYGEMTFHAELTSDNLSEPIKVDETTEVFQ